MKALKRFFHRQGCYPNTAAFAISAVKDGKVVFNQAYGKANREKNIDVTPNTRFEPFLKSHSFSR